MLFEKNEIIWAAHHEYKYFFTLSVVQGLCKLHSRINTNKKMNKMSICDHFRLNNVKHLFHLTDVRDILFQSIYQCISKTKQTPLYFNRIQIKFTLITGIFGLKRELNCWMTSCINNVCFNVCRAFIVRTMAACNWSEGDMNEL